MKALRCKGLHYEDCEKQGCKYIKDGWCDYYRLNNEAADAIEELLRKEKFHAFLWNVISPNDMQLYLEMYHSGEEKQEARE